jgi:hypothetical protein
MENEDINGICRSETFFMKRIHPRLSADGI